MLKHLLFAATLATFPALSQAQNATVSFSDVDLGVGVLEGSGEATDTASYIVKNDGEKTIELLSVVVVGRNMKGTIISSTRWYPVTPETLPNGLQPGESIASHHGIKPEQPDGLIISAEVQVGKVTLSDPAEAQQ